MDDIRYRSNREISLYILNNLQGILLSFPKGIEEKEDKMLGKKKEQVPYQQEIDLSLSMENFRLDDELILNYIEDNHPYSLICDFSSKFSWLPPEIETIRIENDPPVYKTIISVKNKSLTGEAIGSNKKSSKRNAAMKALDKIIKDDYLKKSIKLFIKSITSHRESEDNEEDHEEDKVVEIKSEKKKKATPQDKSLNDKEGVYLSQSKGSATFDDVNHHSKNGYKVKNLNTSDDSSKESQPEEANENIKYMLSKRRLSRASNYNSEDTEDIKSQLVRINLLLEDLNKHHDPLHIQRKFEIFCLKHERKSFTVEDLLKQENFLCELPPSNEAICLFFDGPFLLGSYESNCSTNKTKTVDVLFTHELSDIQVPFEILVKNLKEIYLNDDNDQAKEDLLKELDMTNKYDDLNFDAELKINEFSYNLMIRHKNHIDIEYLEYARTHWEFFPPVVKNDRSFMIVRRLMRLWRRRFGLYFIPPEAMDWILLGFRHLAISETIVKLMYILSKKGKNIFKANEFKDLNFPKVILERFGALSEDEVDMMITSCKRSMDYVSKIEFDNLFL